MASVCHYVGSDCKEPLNNQTPLECTKIMLPNMGGYTYKYAYSAKNRNHDKLKFVATLMDWYLQGAGTRLKLQNSAKVERVWWANFSTAINSAAPFLKDKGLGLLIIE